jgi:hypothetical protein
MTLGHEELGYAGHLISRSMWWVREAPGLRQPRPRHQTRPHRIWCIASSPARCPISCGSPASQGTLPARAKVYCAVVLDAFSWRVVGWSTGSTQTAAPVTSALDMAIRNRAAGRGVVIHSDHGQYTSWAFTGRARASGSCPRGARSATGSQREDRVRPSCPTGSGGGPGSSSPTHCSSTWKSSTTGGGTHRLACSRPSNTNSGQTRLSPEHDHNPASHSGKLGALQSLH